MFSPDFGKMCSNIERCVFCALSMGAFFYEIKGNMYSFEQLDKLTIYSLRGKAREVGVKAPTTLKREELIKEILLIQSGGKEPYVRTAKGRPLKENCTTKITCDEVKLRKEREKRIKKELIDSILKKIEKELYKIL